MKAFEFNNTNIYYHGCKMDHNGNRCIILTIGAGRKFRLQILAFCNGSTIPSGIGKDSPLELSQEAQNIIEKYLRTHGSEAQKRALNL